MPPRRTTRPASSTPTRNLLPAYPSGRTTALESTPLPDVEAEQSFAYGSSITKPLPKQLVAQKNMSIKQLAETLDAGIQQAERNFQSQKERAEQYGISSSHARAARALRRSSERESRASSVESDQTPAPKTSRTRQTASKAQTEQWLEDIDEEATSQGDVDFQEDAAYPVDVVSDDMRSEYASHLPINGRLSTERIAMANPARFVTEQSSMPDISRYDQTYNQERAVHGHADVGLPVDIWGKVLWLLTSVRNLSLRTCNTTWSYFHHHVPQGLLRQSYKTYLTTLIFFGLLVLGAIMARVGCSYYCETPRSYAPTRWWHHQVNHFCRPSTSERWAEMNSSVADTSPTHASALEMGKLISQIKRQEKVVGSMQARQADALSAIDGLSTRQAELLKQNEELQSSLADAQASQAARPAHSSNRPSLASVLSPLYRRINYATPSLGAIIDPYFTSPTKTKHFPLYQRLLLSSAAIKKYQSRPPIEALKHWTEVGDCWCAAAVIPPDSPAGLKMDGQQGRYVQLGVLLGYDVFPDEVVIEYIPLKVTPSPDSAPKDIEVWGDFGYLNQADFTDLTRGPHPVKEVEGYLQLGLLGRFRYSAEANKDGRFTQYFRLEFNQNHENELWVKKVIFRITTNWGGENTCLYRVRVNGVPVHAHPEISTDGLEDE